MKVGGADDGEELKLQRLGADDGEELKLQGENAKAVKNFKCLGSTLSSDGRCEEEVRRRIQAGWMSWKVSGVLCDKKFSAKVKSKMYKGVVRPAMLYEMDTVAVTEKQVKKMEVAELKMIRWALGVTKKKQDNKRICERDCENRKARRQTSEYKTTLVWKREKERRRIRGKKDDGDGGAR